MIKIKRGLRLPINGLPNNSIREKAVKSVGLLGVDYIGMKPTMLVKEGDKVLKGAPVFKCKKNQGQIFTAPASGKVLEIKRGERRIFQSISIGVEETEELHHFTSFKNKGIEEYERQEIVDLIVESGMWSSFRTRPFSQSPDINSVPNSIFINAMDTNPLAMDPEIFINEYGVAFNDGVKLVSKLTEGKTFVCARGGARFNFPKLENVSYEEFTGPHPAGNSGTHIHFLDPVGTKKTVWHINYQDVVALGKLFGNGELFTERWISLGGPNSLNPGILKTRLGANLEDLIDGESSGAESRVVSGSVFSGQKLSSVANFLGRFHLQVSMLPEDRKRVFFGWHDLGLNRYSVMRTFVSKLMPDKKFSFGTSTHGSFRAMVPVGAYEKVMPLDILPTLLLKALAAGDSDSAQSLGCLELDEEDLALCTFVDPGKVDYGPMLRRNLSKIQKEG